MAGTTGPKDHERWAPPGWAWELEAFAFLFVLAAIFAPLVLVLRSGILSAPADSPLVVRAFRAWDQGAGYVWTLLLVGAYFVHVLLANLTLDFVSTPFTHLVAPTLFAAVAYGRLTTFYRVTGLTPRLVQGTVSEALVWLAVVLIITFLLASLRRRRHMARFADVTWDIAMPPHIDRTLIPEIIFKIHPLFYWPRSYRTCGEGILIEGWTYIMPIPFYEVHGIAPADRGDLVTATFYAATSLRSLLQIQLYGRPEPILISPKHPNLFFRYCEQLLAGRSPAEEERRLARARAIAENTTPYGEPDTKGEKDDPYYNV